MLPVTEQYLPNDFSAVDNQLKAGMGTLDCLAHCVQFHLTPELPTL